MFAKKQKNHVWQRMCQLWEYGGPKIIVDEIVKFIVRWPEE